MPTSLTHIDHCLTIDSKPWRPDEVYGTDTALEDKSRMAFKDRRRGSCALNYLSGSEGVQDAIAPDDKLLYSIPGLVKWGDNPSKVSLPVAILFPFPVSRANNGLENAALVIVRHSAEPRGLTGKPPQKSALTHAIDRD